MNYRTSNKEAVKIYLWEQRQGKHLALRKVKVSISGFYKDVILFGEALKRTRSSVIQPSKFSSSSLPFTV